MLEALIFVVFPFCMVFAAVSDMLSMTIANRVSLFALGGMGGGDAKLMAATAVWMGFDIALVQYLVVAAVVGGLLTLAILMFRSSMLAPITKANMFLRHFADEKTGVPYGIALGIGGLIVYPQTPLMIWALERLSA
jgi:prepilin peptidase CpaA